LSNDFIFSTLGNYLVPAWDASTGKYIGNSNSTSSNFFGGFNVGGAQVRGALDIMKENKLAKILAEPTLTAISGQDSEFLAGGEFPVPVPQKDTVTVEFKKFGVQLGFKPEVLKNGAIRMTVSPEVSEMDFSIAVVIQGYTVPGLKTRKAKTQLEVKDGESFVIAGLFRDDISHQVQKVPLLGDIPILGALFRSTEFLNNQTELVIVVTPEVVRSGMAQPGPLPTDDLRVPSDDIELLLMGKMTEKPEAGEGLHRSLNELEGKFGHDPAF
jgi:pilus assembly protein CpaC